MNAPITTHPETVVVQEHVGGFLGLGAHTKDSKVHVADIDTVRVSFGEKRLDIRMSNSSPCTVPSEGDLRSVRCNTGSGLRRVLEQSGLYICGQDMLGNEIWRRHRPPVASSQQKPVTDNRPKVRLGFNRFNNYGCKR